MTEFELIKRIYDSFYKKISSEFTDAVSKEIWWGTVSGLRMETPTSPMVLVCDIVYKIPKVEVFKLIDPRDDQ